MRTARLRVARSGGGSGEVAPRDMATARLNNVGAPGDEDDEREVRCGL